MANQTPEWVIGALKGLFDKYHAIAQLHSTNNGLLVAQDRAANAITDAATRTRIKAAIQSDVKRQALIAGALRGMYASLVNARNTVAATLRTLGVDAYPVSSLAGLGIAPIVIPIAIVTGLAVLGATAAVIWNATNLQRQSVANNTSIINKVLAGQMSVTDAVALMGAAAKQTDESKDLLGLKGIATAFTPIVGLVVAALVIPPLVEAVTKFVPRRRAA